MILNVRDQKAARVPFGLVVFYLTRLNSVFASLGL